jgi:selenocysteine lyase/cysteine desulfurase
MEIGLPVVEARIAALSAELRAALADVPGVTVRDQGARRAGIVTFTVEGLPAGRIVAKLKAQGINVSLSYARWAPTDFAARGLPEMVRASVHAYNSGDEVARFVSAVARLQATGVLG